MDLDIEKFFDRVNHDILMSRIREEIGDVRVRALIGKFIKAGVMIDGVVQSSEEGTPQGGPLSPLLANIYLDPLDRELEKRGLAHVRYADDCNVYVSSEVAAERVKASVIEWIEKHLRLRVNQSKSGSGPTKGRKFLGFSIGENGTVEVAKKSIERFKDKVRELWQRRPVTNQQLREQWNRYVNGWCSYYRLAEERKWLKEVEKWIRRHIRKYYWQRWHNAEGRLNAFKRLGLKNGYWRLARSSCGAWRMAHNPAMHAAISNAALRRYRFLMPSAVLAR